MKFSKVINFILIILISVDILIIYFLITYRPFSRLAIWNIIESNNYNFFYWHPNNAPSLFYFQKQHTKLDNFKKEIIELIKDKNSDLDKVLAIDNYLISLDNNKINKTTEILKWDSADKFLKQIKEGKIGTCFHYSIIFSCFLSSIGIYSRLWSLEGDDVLKRFGHTVVEIYLNDLNKWVMLDVINGIYFKEKDNILSVLDLREKLLNKKTENINILSINPKVKKNRFINIYSRLLKTVFLRTGNDFLDKYDPKIRYGKLFWLADIFDIFPSNIRKGISYLIGRPEYLIHYVDEYSHSLKFQIIIAKIIFYFLCFSLPLSIFLF